MLLGKKLFLTVGELSDQNEKPLVTSSSSVKDVIIEISKKRLGVAAVVENKTVLGVVTAGDVRRMLSNTNDISNLKVSDIMNQNPKTIKADALAVEAKKLMQSHEISQLLVMKNGDYVGVVHIHDLIKEGIL